MKLKLTRFGDYERVVKFPVWSNYMVHVIFTNDIGASRKARYGDAGQSDGARALHSSAQGGHSHIFYRLGNAPSGCIAHEAWHAVRCMMVDFGGVTIMENEVTAYHLGYLVQEIANFRNDLVAANIGTQQGDDKYAQEQSKVLGVKSGSRKQEHDGNEDTQRTVVDVQGLPAHGGGTSTETREEGTPYVSAQADGYGSDLGYRRETTGGL